MLQVLVLKALVLQVLALKLLAVHREAHPQHLWHY